MISSLLIKNLLILHCLEINFQNGFNVLTGETGAGKSILIDCLGFALGHSGRRGSNRKDVSKEGEVVVSFQLDSNNPALKVLHDAGFNVGRELIVRRMVNTEGKKRSFINDKPCTAEFLRNLSSHLVEFQGQNEERGLLYERNHISFLDDFGKCQSMGKSVGQTWTELRKKTSELESLKAESQNMKDRKEFLLAAIAEIEDFNPKVGEENILLDKRKRAKNISRILEHLGNAYSLVSSEKIERAFLSASKELIAFDRLLPK